MKSPLTLILILCLAFCCNPKQEQHKTTTAMNETYHFLLGTYTDTSNQGINILEFDPEANKLEILHITSGIENPSFVIANTAQTLVFATEETGGEKDGKLTSFSLDKATKKLEKINSVYTHGDSPCHISMDPPAQYLVVSNYSVGNIAVIQVDKEGRLSEAAQIIQHQGSSVHPTRQKQPHVHSAVFHPREQKVFVADLGTDKIFVYDVNDNTAAPLSAAPTTFSVATGAGPRHLAFNKSGDRLYLIHEISGEIGAYAYEGNTIQHLATYPLKHEGFGGEVGAAELRFSPDGKYLYASNRGEVNNLAAFEIDESGELTQIQTLPSGGEAPRNFIITPDGKYLLCGNQNSNEVVSFKRNTADGTLTPTDVSLSVNKPVYFYLLE